MHSQVFQKSYEAYNVHNYYNLIISILPYWPEGVIRYLLTKKDPVHKWLLLYTLKIWEMRHGFSSSWPYKAAKVFITKVLRIKPPDADVSPINKIPES